MSVLEKALKVEKDKLEEQERCLREYLTEALPKLKYVDRRLGLVSRLLGKR